MSMSLEWLCYGSVSVLARSSGSDFTVCLVLALDCIEEWLGPTVCFRVLPQKHVELRVIQRDFGRWIRDRNDEGVDCNISVRFNRLRSCQKRSNVNLSHSQGQAPPLELEMFCFTLVIVCMAPVYHSSSQSAIVVSLQRVWMLILVQRLWVFGTWEKLLLLLLLSKSSKSKKTEGPEAKVHDDK
ncbi:hypothetical protein C8R48DRAFT_671351 [Suillus tomentosus]|nr:hypothetical protein C8R48DRAFT_671351 [Suillus tomentosus]